MKSNLNHVESLILNGSINVLIDGQKYDIQFQIQLFLKETSAKKFVRLTNVIPPFELRNKFHSEYKKEVENKIHRYAKKLYKILAYTVDGTDNCNLSQLDDHFMTLTHNKEYL